MGATRICAVVPSSEDVKKPLSLSFPRKREPMRRAAKQLNRKAFSVRSMGPRIREDDSKWFFHTILRGNDKGTHFYTRSSGRKGWGEGLVPLLCFLLLLWSHIANAAIILVDSTGICLRLQAPAHRVISLSPNLSEILFDIGAGKTIIARDKNSDYPAVIQQVPIISSSFKLNIERILRLKPELIVIEQFSHFSKDLQCLREMGIPVYVNKAESIKSLEKTIQDLGKLTGNEANARSKAMYFAKRIDFIQRKYAKKKKLTVFFELWDQPLLTVNHRTIIHEMITYCGGKNIFSDLLSTSPRVSLESVLVHNPQIILSSKSHFEKKWQSFPHLYAVNHGHLFCIPPNNIERTGPRLLDGLVQICEALEKVRCNSSAQD